MEFMGRDFLLNGQTASTLFQRYAEGKPIIDYHNHLSPKDIAQHRVFHNLTELWLETDHYKWRAMRACGVPEELITGKADAYDMFLAWAGVVPQLAGCPLYHWTHLELQRYFDIHVPLTPETAPAIWEETCGKLRQQDAVSLLAQQNIRALCTTDDPADTLEWHSMIRQDTDIPFTVLPSFRPDLYLHPECSHSQADLKRLAASVGMDITDMDSLKLALCAALDRFQENGCKVADHGLAGLGGDTDGTCRQLLLFLGREYRRRGMVMQLHLGPIRDQSPRLLRTIGHDAGGDSVGMTSEPAALGSLLAALEDSGGLPRTILYNLNPAENTVFSTMAVNFAPYVQYGAAWWFNDTLRGINAQLDELMETGQLARSAGMLTDSRSFTSFPRHEYYRRILCGKLGQLVESGQYPADIAALGHLVENVCWKNAADLLDISV